VFSRVLYKSHEHRVCDKNPPNSVAQMHATPRTFTPFVHEYLREFEYRRELKRRKTQMMPAIELRFGSAAVAGSDVVMETTSSAMTNLDGFQRMDLLRTALAAIDRRGWRRSYHQRQFHNDYLRACARIFFKTEPPGAFERAHKKILETYSWDSLPQEVCISTPRRFGKTISISMFCAALIFSAAGVECSIYSTCKRISQKLLRGVCKFLDMIHEELAIKPFKAIRKNQEELMLQGPDGAHDVRIVNSYPSRVNTHPTPTVF
jgi:hypothetical protein